MTELNCFFESLAKDAVLQGQYQSNPEEVMKAHGLSDEEAKAVMLGNTDRLKKMSGDDEDGWSFLIISNM